MIDRFGIPGLHHVSQLIALGSQFRSKCYFKFLRVPSFQPPLNANILFLRSLHQPFTYFHLLIYSLHVIVASGSLLIQFTHSLTHQTGDRASKTLRSCLCLYGACKIINKYVQRVGKTPNGETEGILPLSSVFINTSNNISSTMWYFATVIYAN